MEQGTDFCSSVWAHTPTDKNNPPGWCPRLADRAHAIWRAAFHTV